MGNFNPRLYEVLGRLNHDASPEEIKKAYRTYAKLYHSDTTEEDPEYAKEMMTKLNDAYEILSKTDKRREYDEQLKIHIAEEERRKVDEKLKAQQHARERQKCQSQESSNSSDPNWGALAGVALGLLALGLIIDAFSDTK